MVGIGGVGGINSREGDKVEGTFFCPGGNLRKKGLKKYSPVDFAYQKNKERLGEKYVGGG